MIFNDPLHTDAVADVVLGQADFVSGSAFGGGLASAANFNAPTSLALDASGNLYVADSNGNRVLRFAPPFSNHMNASQVFGQPNFSTITPITIGVTAAALNVPVCVTVDSQGNLYVADAGNNRVLEYDSPTVNAVATRVFGQPDFTTTTSGVSAKSMSFPRGVGIDPAGNLYVIDSANNRLLEFNSPLASSAAANRVFGQGGSFTSGLANNGGRNPASLYSPYGHLAFDANRNLYVSDLNNYRVLSYDHPTQNPPALMSAAQATPNTAQLGQPVNFSAAGTDPDNDVLTYTWDFGDGTTGSGASVSHTYSLVGVLMATLTVDDGYGGTVSSSVMVTVSASGTSSGPPGTPGAPAPLGDVKMGVKLNFVKPNADQISVSGTLELPAGVLSGPVTVQVADLTETFTFSPTVASNTDGKFSVTSKGTAARAAKFKLTLSKKTFAPSLVSAGLVNMTVITPVQVPVTLTLNGIVYQITANLKYTGKQGIGGSAK